MCGSETPRAIKSTKTLYLPPALNPKRLRTDNYEASRGTKPSTQKAERDHRLSQERRESGR